MTGLNLLAEDAEDLAVISTHCQDAAVPLNDMAYLESDRRFLLVLSRFCWETPPESTGEGPPVFSRIHSVLRVDHVRAARLRGLDLKDRRRVLELLSIRPTADGVQLDFADDAAVRLVLDRLQLALSDYGEAWPTTHCPAHPLADDSP